MALTPEQQAAIDSVKAVMAQQQEPQRLRMMAQGATFNTADEIEAAARAAATGRPQQEIAQEIRQGLRSYQQESPIASKAYEFAGAVLPSLAAVIATRNPVPAVGVFSNFLPNLAKVVGLGAAEGAAQTVGGMEQPFSERFNEVSPILYGAGVGGITAGGLQTGGTGLVKGLDVVTEAARFASGSRARNAVTNEVQRIAAEAGIDVAEAEARLLRGELIAEDPNVALQLRGYMGQGEAGANIRGTMQDRPAATRRTAFETIRSGIAAGLDRNIYRHMRASAEQLRELQNREYKEAFKTAGDAPQAVVDQMYETIARFPSGGNKLKEAFKSETGRDPFFVIDDLGKISFRMLPTMRDAEVLRRIVADEAWLLTRGGGAGATTGVNLGEAETLLRSSIDTVAPQIGEARGAARLIFQRNNNYKAGLQANSKSADEIQVEFNKVLNSRDPGLIQAYRLGYLQNLQAKIQSGNKASIVNRLTDPESKEGLIFRTIYPEDLQEAALSRLEVASQAQTASNTVLQGSQTAQTQAAQARQGMMSDAVRTSGLAADALRGDVGAAATILDRMIQQFRPGLTDTNRSAIARLLLSSDPLIVRWALTDTEALKSLQAAIISLSQSPTMTAALAGTTFSSDAGQQ
jgi:hypothetical protein